MAQISGFDPTTQVKTCFDCKMFDVANWVACLNREDGLGGTPSHEALSLSMYLQSHRCFEHKRDGSHCLCLPSDSSPSQGDPKDQAMPLPNHRNSPRLARDVLVLGPSAALNRYPITTPSVNDSTQTVPQVCVPQQSATAQLPRLVSRSGQLQEKGFSVEVAERIAASQQSSTRTTTSQSGPYLKNGAEKIWWISPLHL